MLLEVLERLSALDNTMFQINQKVLGEVRNFDFKVIEKIVDVVIANRENLKNFTQIR